MAVRQRAARAAQELLRSEGSTVPVPVEQIARKYARLIRETLPAETSGMLVPLPETVPEPRWAIVINAGDALVRQRFTIAHELGHLVLHKYTAPHADGRLQVRFRDEESAKGSVREEIEANQFAAELLMPETDIRALAPHLRHDMFDAASDAKALKRIQTFAKKFQVSAQAMSLRIANITAG